MSDIQKARDVLAKWRNKTTPGPWQDEGNYVAAPGWTVASTMFRDTALIVGTAGNSDLWDEQDAMFARAIELADISGSEPLVVFAKRIADAILSADERMSA